MVLCFHMPGTSTYLFAVFVVSSCTPSLLVHPEPRTLFYAKNGLLLVDLFTELEVWFCAYIVGEMLILHLVQELNVVCPTIYSAIVPLTCLFLTIK